VRAIVAPEAGGPEVLRLVDLPDPRAGPGDLLVQVAATAVNRADVLQRRGRYPPPPGASDVLGLEIAGEIAELGRDVTGWRVGDRVCGVLAGGGYAELAVLPAGAALPVPARLDLVDAAALPEVFTTALDNLCNRGRLSAGETVLLHGGSSGVGTAAIQVCKRLGARVLVTARSAAKLRACARLGADAGIEYPEQDFEVAVHELTGGRGVDVVLDIVGGAYLARNLRCLAEEGRLVIIGLGGGAAAELDIARLLTRRLTVTGSTLRSRSAEQKAALAQQVRRELWSGFDDGSLRPVIDRVLPLDQAARAHARLESSEHVGKIVLVVPPW
jgi:putative PIG3 family NAD(P)H quinone oxidoreductase